MALTKPMKKEQQIVDKTRFRLNAPGTSIKGQERRSPFHQIPGNFPITPLCSRADS